MASTINASTSAGLVQTADTSGVLQLQTASTTAVTVDASQNVGVGTASPADALNVGTAKKFRATHSASVYQQIFSSASGNFYNAIGDNFQLTADVGALYLSTTASQPMVFQTSNTDRVTVLGNGTVKTSSTISVGNATPSTSGAGITFPASQSASSNANTLDDYEEGTWTPVLGGTGGTSGQTYSYQVGRYTKIGRQVICSFEAELSAVGTVTDYAAISGLPFTSTGTSTNLDAGGCLITFASGLATNQIYITAYIFNGETRAWVTGAAAAGTAIGNITATNIWGNSSRIAGTISYTAS
jgi:hypothetical protein